MSGRWPPRICSRESTAKFHGCLDTQSIAFSFALSLFLFLSFSLSLCHSLTLTHTHTYTHTYIYIHFLFPSHFSAVASLTALLRCANGLAQVQRMLAGVEPQTDCDARKLVFHARSYGFEDLGACEWVLRGGAKGSKAVLSITLDTFHVFCLRMW